MEFHEKLQELRKKNNLTQEELAEALYVSRTAISKWESGRGYPNIDSLKAIAKFFQITVDELLSGEELLTIAENDQKQKEGNARDLVFGLLDVSVAMLLFLPIFAQRAGERVLSVSLLALSAVSPWLRIVFSALVIGSSILGVLLLALQNCECACWMRNKHKISMVLSVVCVAWFTVSLQPYPAILLLLFLIIKAFLMLKKQ